MPSDRAHKKNYVIIFEGKDVDKAENTLAYVEILTVNKIDNSASPIF